MINVKFINTKNSNKAKIQSLLPGPGMETVYMLGSGDFC